MKTLAIFIFCLMCVGIAKAETIYNDDLVVFIFAAPPVSEDSMESGFFREQIIQYAPAFMPFIQPNVGASTRCQIRMDDVFPFTVDDISDDHDFGNGTTYGKLKLKDGTKSDFVQWVVLPAGTPLGQFNAFKKLAYRELPIAVPEKLLPRDQRIAAEEARERNALRALIREEVRAEMAANP